MNKLNAQKVFTDFTTDIYHHPLWSSGSYRIFFGTGFVAAIIHCAFSRRSMCSSRTRIRLLSFVISAAKSVVAVLVVEASSAMNTITCNVHKTYYLLENAYKWAIKLYVGGVMAKLG